MADRKLLIFVCTGNICRSPMAEYLMKERLGKDSNWDVISTGLAAGFGMSASRTAQEVVDAQGIDMSAHMSKPLEQDLVDLASIIIVMTESHLREMERLYPEAREKVFLMRSFDPSAESKEVADPIGSSEGIYRDVKGQIELAIPGLNDFMNELDV